MAVCFIDFRCTGQELERVDAETVAANAANTVAARFDLCEKWQGLNVYARFQHGAAVYDVPIIDGAAVVPWETLKYPGFSVSVFGEDADGARLTAARVFVDVKRSIDYDGAQPIPATPSLLQSFEGKVNECLIVKAQAEAGEFNGEPFRIAEVYASVDAMESDAGSVPVGAYVLVSNDGAENGDLYEWTAEGWQFVFNMLTARGLDGENGAAAGFGSVTASVDSNTGTPAVTVEVSGDDTEKNFAFAFSGLKGEPGKDGADGADGKDGESLPEGGAPGQVLKRTSDGAIWGDAITVPLPVEQGGTGARNAEAARELLGAAAADHTHVIPRFEFGNVVVAAKAESVVTQDVSFSQAFESAPCVMAAFGGNLVTGFSELAVSANDVTATGFTLRVSNAGATGYNAAIRWFAIL